MYWNNELILIFTCYLPLWYPTVITFGVNPLKPSGGQALALRHSKHFQQVMCKVQNKKLVIYHCQRYSEKKCHMLVHYCNWFASINIANRNCLYRSETSHTLLKWERRYPLQYRQSAWHCLCDLLVCRFFSFSLPRWECLNAHFVPSFFVFLTFFISLLHLCFFFVHSFFFPSFHLFLEMYAGL